MAPSLRPKDDGPKDLLEWLGLKDAPNWKVARPLGALFGVCLAFLLAVAFAAAVWTVFKTFVPPDGIHTNITGGIGSSALLVAILGAPFLIWSTVIKHKALGFQKEGHITDRISKAVEHLGADKTDRQQRLNDKGTRVYLSGHDGEPDFSKPVFDEKTVPNIEVRVGGILSLERIAQDSLGSSFKCNTHGPRGIGCCDGQTIQAPWQRGTWRDFGRASAGQQPS